MTIERPYRPEFEGQPIRLHQMEGRKVVTSEIGNDPCGYTTLFISFDDGTAIVFQEQGQDGFFTYENIQPSAEAIQSTND